MGLATRRQRLENLSKLAGGLANHDARENNRPSANPSWQPNLLWAGDSYSGLVAFGLEKESFPGSRFGLLLTVAVFLPPKFPNSTVEPVWTARTSRHICLAYPRDVHCELLFARAALPCASHFRRTGYRNTIVSGGDPDQLRGHVKRQVDVNLLPRSAMPNHDFDPVHLRTRCEAPVQSSRIPHIPSGIFHKPSQFVASATIRVSPRARPTSSRLGIG